MQEPSWIAVQSKTFTKWLNTKLPVPVKDIFEDLKDGTKLCKLIHILSETLIIHNEPAITRFQKIENVQKVIDYLHEKKLKLINIGSCDIVDGNVKLTLGLIWTIIKRFVIMKDDCRNDGLLKWCKAVTAGYDVNVNNFGRSWQDGMAFNAIIHRFRPDLINYNELKRNDKLKNLEDAFSIAEKSLGIPKLLDPEDIAFVVNPDEKSVMTYVSTFYEKFGDLKENQSKKKLDDFIYAYENSRKLENEYEFELKDYLKNKNIIEKNNLRGKEILDEYKKMVNENLILEDDLKVKKTILTSFLGTINSINNFYKNEKKEVVKELNENVCNELKFCSKCMQEIKVIEKNNFDSEKYCKILESNEALESQMIPLEKLNLELKNLSLKKVVEERIKLFGNLINKKDSKKIVFEAHKMFSSIDSERKNLILKEDAREILRILQINDERFELKKDYNLEEFLFLVKFMYNESFNIQKIKNDFLSSSADGKFIKEINEENKEKGMEKVNLGKLFGSMNIKKGK